MGWWLKLVDGLPAQLIQTEGDSPPDTGEKEQLVNYYESEEEKEIRLAEENKCDENLQA